MSDITAPAARITARFPAPSPWPARRTLQIVLGLVWLVDAALQFQPYMFSTAFVTKIIDPAAAGNPALIAAPITWSARLMAQHIVAANTAFALTQLAIAAGLLYRRTVTLALAASIGWSVMVWWFGEGLGGTLTGASPLAGLAGLTAGHGLAVSALLAALCAMTGLAIFERRLTRPALILASLLALLIWTAEGFGGIVTGQATDPNTGPLLILLAACYWPPRARLGARRAGPRPVRA